MKKILFIAYSHDNEEHKAWVKKFADDISRFGNFEVLLDQSAQRQFFKSFYGNWIGKS